MKVEARFFRGVAYVFFIILWASISVHYWQLIPIYHEYGNVAYVVLCEAGWLLSVVMVTILMLVMVREK